MKEVRTIAFANGRHDYHKVKEISFRRQFSTNWFFIQTISDLRPKRYGRYRLKPDLGLVGSK